MSNSDTPAATAATLSDREYHERSHAVLGKLESTLDLWLEDDVIDIDARRTGGLLEMSLPDGSKLVVNTQPPLQEIWLAAKGGGFHFRHADGRWVDTKDGRDFYDVLSACASEQAGKALRFEPA